MNYKNDHDGLTKDLELAKSYGVDVYFYPAMKELFVDELSIPIEMVEKVYDSMRNPPVPQAGSKIVSLFFRDGFIAFTINLIIGRGV